MVPPGRWKGTKSAVMEASAFTGCPGRFMSKGRSTTMDTANGSRHDWGRRWRKRSRTAGLGGRCNRAGDIARLYLHLPTTRTIAFVENRQAQAARAPGPERHHKIIRHLGRRLCATRGFSRRASARPGLDEQPYPHRHPVMLRGSLTDAPNLATGRQFSAEAGPPTWADYSVLRFTHSISRGTRVHGRHHAC